LKFLAGAVRVLQLKVSHLQETSLARSASAEELKTSVKDLCLGAIVAHEQIMYDLKSELHSYARLLLRPIKARLQSGF
jgi:hypothetical protein